MTAILNTLSGRLQYFMVFNFSFWRTIILLWYSVTAVLHGLDEFFPLPVYLKTQTPFCLNLRFNMLEIRDFSFLAGGDMPHQVFGFSYLSCLSLSARLHFLASNSSIRDVALCPYYSFLCLWSHWCLASLSVADIAAWCTRVVGYSLESGSPYCMLCCLMKRREGARVVWAPPTMYTFTQLIGLCH